jgi:glycosyltransferase involved in cell wall biosynthesis
MHILWFTGVELPAVKGGGLTRAGWQENLRRALYQYSPDIRLSIAAFGSKPYQPFQMENATYYNIYREAMSGSRWQRLLKNWKHRTFSEQDLERSYAVYQQIKPDLVFIFGTENPFGLLADRFFVPSVVSIQAVLNGLVGSLFQGLTWQELLEELFSRKTLTGQGLYHKWWSHINSARIERKIYKQVNIFCGRTDWDKSWQKRLNPQAQYFHIDRVLGQEYYQASWRLDTSEDQRIFSLLGNAPFKGGITLVRAAALLKARNGKRLQVRLAGIDPNSMVGKNIGRIVQQESLDGQIFMLGRLQRDQIIKEMKAARLFVLPSHLDNSPNSLAEAMVVGMPCLASNAGGIPSLLADGHEGLIYLHDDVTALADGIEKMLSNSQYAEQLGFQARKTARERHDPEKIANATRQMYQTVFEEWGD